MALSKRDLVDFAFKKRRPPPSPRAPMTLAGNDCNWGKVYIVCVALELDQECLSQKKITEEEEKEEEEVPVLGLRLCRYKDVGLTGSTKYDSPLTEICSKLGAFRFSVMRAVICCRVM